MMMTTMMVVMTMMMVMMILMMMIMLVDAGLWLKVKVVLGVDQLSKQAKGSLFLVPSKSGRVTRLSQ